VTTMLKLAAAQYPIDQLARWSDFRDKVTRWVAEAAGEGARLLVFPEYFSIEITSIFGEEVYSSLPLQLEKLQRTLADFLALFRELAQTHHVHICAGSYPVREGEDYYNRSYFFWPNGHCEFQEKLQMTRFENEHWHVSAGSGLKVFATEFGKLAINVCYDSEFPHYARQQAERGATLILVPSCTDTEAGYYRVRIGCQARALENQCYVVQASLVGNAEWSEAVDVNCGAAAIYTPVDRGFPNDGVLAIGEYNRVQWVYADLDLAAVDTVRREGQVFNYRDWPKQFDCR